MAVVQIPMHFSFKLIHSGTKNCEEVGDTMYRRSSNIQLDRSADKIVPYVNAHDTVYVYCKKKIQWDVCAYLIKKSSQECPMCPIC